MHFTLENVDTGKKYTLVISHEELTSITLIGVDKTLISECAASRSVADKLVGLEIITRMIETEYGIQQSKHVNYEKEGNMICAFYDDFIDLQCSVAGFGNTKEKARSDLEKSAKGHAHFKYKFYNPLITNNKCPQCNGTAGLKFPRNLKPYCEDCGWPEEDFNE